MTDQPNAPAESSSARSLPPGADELEARTDEAATSDVVLEPQISARWALAPRHLATLGLFCLLAMVLNYLPLRGTDLWGHVAYGDWILEHGQLPTEDPFASLTQGMRVIDSAWLSQLIFASLERLGGAEALSTAFTILTLAYFVAVTRACYLQSRRVSIAACGLAVAFIVGFSRLTTIRPENFGAAAFGILLWALVAHRMISRHDALETSPETALPRRPAWRLCAAVFVIMCLWANLHGSFVCGLAVLGCLLAGRVIETLASAFRDGDGLGAVLADGESRRLLVLLEIGVLATLVNPYGLDLLVSTLGFSQNEILDDVLEWQPLRLMGIGGREFAFSWIVITLVLRHSRQRVRVGEALMLGLFALLAASRLRMIGWYAAVAAVFLAPHLADIWSRFAPPLETEPQVKQRDNPLELTTQRSWTYSLVALLMVWITFALSPLGRPVVGDEPRTPDQIYDQQTPLAATEFLREHPPQGRVFNPQWWGDWLVWAGPPGIEPFVTTNMHLIPSQVWQDYRRIMAVDSGWSRVMSRYRIETAVLDKERQSRLVRAVRSSGQWLVAFEDEQAVIFVRDEQPQRSEPAGDADDAAPDAANEESNQ